MMKLKRLTLDDKSKIESFTLKFPPYSDFNFISLYSWSLHSQTFYYLDEELFVIRMPDYSSQDFIYTFMILDNIPYNFLRVVKSFNQNNGLKFNFLPEVIIDELSEYLEGHNINHRLIENRDEFDYLLDVDLSANAVGKQYSDFRYKISKFKREWLPKVNPYNFDPTNNKDIKLAENLLNDWVTNKQPNGLNYEYESLAYSRFLTIAKYSDALRFKAYEYKGKLVCLCSYELLDNKISIGHFVKYDPIITNILPFVINEVCKDLKLEGFKTINIEQDLGIPSLRVSKEHLRPVGFLKKYTLEVY